MSYKEGYTYYYKKCIPTINTYILKKLDKLYMKILKKLNLYKYTTLERIKEGTLILPNENI